VIPPAQQLCRWLCVARCTPAGVVRMSHHALAQAFSRVAAGFTLTIIDTPGLLEGDAVNTGVRSPVCDVLLSASRASWAYEVPNKSSGGAQSTPCRLLCAGPGAAVCIAPCTWTIKRERYRVLVHASRNKARIAGRELVFLCALPDQALAGIAYEVRGRPVDAVLYLHRLDDYRVDAADVQARSPLLAAACLGSPSACMHRLDDYRLGFPSAACRRCAGARPAAGQGLFWPPYLPHAAARALFQCAPWLFPIWSSCWRALQAALGCAPLTLRPCEGEHVLRVRSMPALPWLFSSAAPDRGQPLLTRR
jgi:hypothetical protein